MEQLQDGYVAAVAAAAGCTAEPIPRDIYGLDVRFVRPGAPGEEETILQAQLKSTTTIKPDPSKPHFSYQLKKREYFDTLAMYRKGPKAILIVMAVNPKQATWAVNTHDAMTIQHCCYWECLEGRTVDPAVRSPSVPITTDHIFNAAALTELMDRVGRGESLQ